MLKRSPIIKKKCKCQECTDNPEKAKWPTLSCFGYNYNHLPEDLKEKAGTKRKVQVRNKNKRVALSSKLHKAQRELNGDSELDLWFMMRMNTCLPQCENCGAIKNDLKHEIFKNRWKSCQAHLLPKRHFISLRAHPLNGMVLGSGFSGMCYCHDSYDSNWDAASKMGIWQEVVRRFKIMYPLILPSEHRFIPKQLLDTLD